MPDMPSIPDDLRRTDGDYDAEKDGREGYALAVRAKRLERAVVYFAQNSRSGDVKIGWTTDLPQRLSALKSGAGADLHVIRVVDGGQAKERWLHKRFAAQRISGEWFEYHPDMLSVIPPDEIIRPRKEVIRRDVRLTVYERLRDAEATGRAIGLSDRLILTTFVATLNDDEARAFIETMNAARLCPSRTTETKPDAGVS